MSGINSTPYSTVVGPARVYVAAVGTAFPVTDLAAPAAAWIDLGETDGGFEFSPKRTTKKHNTDQSFAPKKVTVTDKSITLSFTLAQVTLERLAAVLDGQAISDVAAGAGTAGYKKLILGSLAVIPQYAMLARVPSPYTDGYLQFEMACVSPAGEQKMSYKKDEQTMVPTEWDVWENPSSAGVFGEIRAFTAAAL